MNGAGASPDEELWADVAPPAARRLLDAALDRFAERGFHATTTRDVAQSAGLSPAAVYVHYPSKGDLLFRISLAGHEAALAAALAAPGDAAEPAERLRRLVSDVAVWHAAHHRLARVLQYELGALEPERRREIVALRRRFADVFRGEIEAGARSGAFAVEDVEGAALALQSLCVDIARWYRPGADRAPERLGALYGEFALRLVGAIC